MLTPARARGQCPVCRAAGRACAGHPSTAGRNVVDLPTRNPGGASMPLVREQRTTPSGTTYVIKVPAPEPAAQPEPELDEAAPEHKARPAPRPAARRRRTPAKES